MKSQGKLRANWLSRLQLNDRRLGFWGQVIAHLREFRLICVSAAFVS